MPSPNLEVKLDKLTQQLADLLERQRRRDELFDEMVPILKLAMGVATQRLSSLEQKGYFAFGNSLLEVADSIVGGYSPQDVKELASSIVTILDTVRALTQPHAMQVMREAGEVVEQAENIEPLGMMGMLKASREENVQRGMAVMLEVLRHVGKGAQQADRRERLRKQIGSRATRDVPTHARRPVAAAPARAATAPAVAPPTAAAAKTTKAAVPNLPGVTFTEEGFLVDATQWNREVAVAIAQRLGVELTERHWLLIEHARKDFEQTGASPNIRRLTKVSGIDTREVYVMFPRAPGKCCAMVAGLPKPVGCI